MASILVIDDDRSHCALVEAVAPALGLTVDWVAAKGFDIAKLDLLRPTVVVHGDALASDASRSSLIERLACHHAKIPLIAIAARPTAAIEAIRAGACEVLFQPLVAAELRDALAKAVQLRRPGQTCLAVRDTAELTGAGTESLIGRSHVMRAVYKAIGMAAAHDVSLLILGETGTGKRTIARAIHEHSKPRQGALAVIECDGHTHFDAGSALPTDSKGRTKRSTGPATPLPQSGTCLLVDVDELSGPAQRQLLRYVQSWHDRNVGRDDDKKADAPRVIATANAATAAAAIGSNLLAELYYQLGRFVIVAPPLRQRTEDLPLLAEHFVRLWSRRLGKRVYQLSSTATDLLAVHDWPGNLQELSSTVCQAVACAKGSVLTADDFAHLAALVSSAESASADPAIVDWRQFVDEQLTSGDQRLYATALEAMDQRLLKLVLERMEGNQARAAKALGMTRGRLRQKLREQGMTIDRRIEVHSCS